MGFGSYDESEQERQESGGGPGDESTVDAHENDHEGEMTFDSGASTDDLVSRLQEMKDDDEDDEE
ncbi:DUF5786 family protein [Halorarum salinum]|uniref:Death domain-associated protein n=1 Tax=Halorarum salinum TaxID=2743089 RepID=A0A7D5QDW3_9EURY|nr:DUF5786 family protein [Halobaculum salinum]QLG62441.1 death domain-associated protein [Halobaculum salinum]